MKIGINKFQYYRVSDDRVSYKGERYFKFNPDEEQVVQLCVSTGDTKRGTGNNVGVYYIHRNTFCSNYLARPYLTAITQKQYEKKLVELLQFMFRKEITDKIFNSKSNSKDK